MARTESRWNAEEYAQHSSAQAHWARELIGKLALRGYETLLDIGCGDGKISAEIARIVAIGRVTGLDSSAEMIRLAAESFPREQYPNLTFVRQDATAIHLEEVFDVVFSNAALHWVRDHVAVLRGIRHCLRPRGRILLQIERVAENYLVSLH